MVPIIIGASSLHHALQTRDPQLQQKAETLSGNVYSDTGICLHPLAKNPKKSLQNIIKNFDYGQEFIVWDDVINNTITDHPFDPRTHRSSAQLLKEIRALKQIVGVVYCEREGAPGIQSELKTLNIPVVNVVKDLISNRKRKDSSKNNEYNELHQQHSLVSKLLSITVSTSIDSLRNERSRTSNNEKRNDRNWEKLGTLNNL